jgi:hypothetical protein
VNRFHDARLSSKMGILSSNQSPIWRVHSWTRGPWISVRASAILVRKDWKAGTWCLRRKYVFRRSRNSSDLVRSPSKIGGSCPIGFTSLGCPTFPKGSGPPWGNPPPGGPPPRGPLPWSGGGEPCPPWFESGVFGLLPCGGSIWTRVTVIVVVAISGDTIGEVFILSRMGASRN